MARFGPLMAALVLLQGCQNTQTSEPIDEAALVTGGPTDFETAIERGGRVLHAADLRALEGQSGIGENADGGFMISFLSSGVLQIDQQRGTWQVQDDGTVCFDLTAGRTCRQIVADGRRMLFFNDEGALISTVIMR